MKTYPLLVLSVMVSLMPFNPVCFASSPTPAAPPKPPPPLAGNRPPPPLVPKGFPPPPADGNTTAAATEVEPVDGVGNNADNPAWGSTGADLLRLAPSWYADGVSAPALPDNPSARAISNLVNSQADPNNPSQDILTVDRRSLADFGYAFGQFMDHDLDLTPDGGASFPIAVAANDPIGPAALPFTRSETDPATGTSAQNPLQQVTVVTSYFDLSQVYGSSEVVADALRTFQNGLLKTSPGNMLPYDNETYFTADQIAALNMANDAEMVPESSLFAAGDVRANENIELTVLETLFVRNHNALAAKLKKTHPKWTDKQLYQEARKINIAGYQSIVYNEWIPAVLGPNALRPYAGYNPNVDATIANEFSTVAFRFGHSLVSGGIARDGNNGQTADAGISLAFDFFDPNLLNPAKVVDPLTGLVSSDIDEVLKGEADGNGQAMDTMAINDIRNLLFGNGLGGDDLMARDVQRGRDNGMPDYNDLRAALGLPAVSSFSQITADVQVQDELGQAYPGGLYTIDAFEGGLAEDAMPDSDVGPLFQTIMVNQFERLRDGDRFFYLNESANPEEVALFQQVNTLAKVITANTRITNLQSNAIVFHASISGIVSTPPVKGVRPAGPARANGLPGVTVYLEDTASDILATTLTDQNGAYLFNEQSGPSANPDVTPGVSVTGTYEIVVVPPAGLRQTTGAGPVTITRGDTNVGGINFSLVPSKAAQH
jgi:peroxidase